MGVVDTVFSIFKEDDRQLQLIELCEDDINCHTRWSFRLLAHSDFATSSVDASLRAGDFVAVGSPCLRETSQYKPGNRWHYVEACIGFSEPPTEKIIYARKPTITYAGTSRWQNTASIPVISCILSPVPCRILPWTSSSSSSSTTTTTIASRQESKSQVVVESMLVPPDNKTQFVRVQSSERNRTRLCDIKGGGN